MTSDGGQPQDGPVMSELSRLLAAYGGADAERHGLVWRFDARLADLVRTTREPMIGQMRLTWWHEALTDGSGAKGRGEPLLADLRAAGLAPAGEGSGLLAMIDGWEALLADPVDDDALCDYARARGGGLFRALAKQDDIDASLIAAGAVWALWDLSGHVGDEILARRAIELAVEEMRGVSALRWPAHWRAHRIAYGIARSDVAARRVAPATLTPSLYGRLLRVALIGR